MFSRKKYNSYKRQNNFLQSDYKTKHKCHIKTVQELLLKEITMRF